MIKDPTFTKIGEWYSICTYAHETETELEKPPAGIERVNPNEYQLIRKFSEKLYKNEFYQENHNIRTSDIIT